jgi:hypothetical protein
MNPEYWGPSFWKILHTISMNYPDNPTQEDKNNINNFYTSLDKILPCYECQNNYKEHIKKYPIEKSLGCKNDLVKWVIDIHNIVNTELNKPVLNYNDALSRCYKDCDKEKENLKNQIQLNKSNLHYYKNLFKISLFIIICLLITILMRGKKKKFF